MRALALLLLASTAYANPLDVYGLGSRGAALGGAMTAAVDDTSANYYNPAALVRGNDLRIDIGYRYAQPELTINGRNNGVEASRGLSVGIAAPAKIGPVRFAFGASLFLPDQHLTRIRSLAYQTPRFPLYENPTQQLVLEANLAIQIIRGLYVGAGLTYMSRTQGQVFLKGTISPIDASAATLESNVSVDLLAVRYPQVGALWELTRSIALGLCYRHTYALKLDQAFRIDGNIGQPGGTPIVTNGHFAARAVSTDLFQPWQLQGGAAVHVKRDLLVSFDLAYVHWSAYPVPASQLTLDIDVGMYNNLLKLPKSRTYPSANFHDIVVPHLGVEGRVLDTGRIALDVRGGYVYEATPVPKQIGESNFADSDKHTFSIGLGVELRKLGNILPLPLAFDVHAALTYLPNRDNPKTDPRDAVGDFIAGGLVPQVGITMRTRF
jgi:long-chain fatty acid transport protein